MEELGWQSFIEYIELGSLCLMWTLSREPNNRAFEDTKSLVIQFITLFSITLFDWSCAWVLPIVIPYLNFKSCYTSVYNIISLQSFWPSFCSFVYCWKGNISLYLLYAFCTSLSNDLKYLDMPSRHE